jgi:hypothetical protein
MSANKFVFVVCGASEHINTLHFSLHALKKFSNNEIIILTDSSRNEIPVVHSLVVDIKTPEHLNHHQASIFLKTSIHRCLPAGHLYCYLDTDIVALSKEADSIFSFYTSPITFCKDHCRINAFSPAAIHCGCQQRFDEYSNRLTYYLVDFEHNILPRLNYIDLCIAEIDKLEKDMKGSKWNYKWHTFKYTLPGKYYMLNDKYKMDKSTGFWYDKAGILLKYEKINSLEYVYEKTGFLWVADKKEWHTSSGESFTNPTCQHLGLEIKSKFHITITPANWHHWNGGVFLFDDSSHEFLKNWHHATIDIFNDAKWKTRDQGTLAATAWKFGLQDQPTLPIEYNFIADHNNKSVCYMGDMNFSFEDSHQIIHPYFIHVFHHWGDEKWQVWCDVRDYF